MEKIENYLDLNNKYLKEAETLVDRKDYVQAVASALHQNFYENWLTPEMVVENGKAVNEFVARLASIA